MLLLLLLLLHLVLLWLLRHVCFGLRQVVKPKAEVQLANHVPEQGGKRGSHKEGGEGKERERERVCVCVCVRERVCVCACVRV